MKAFVTGATGLLGGHLAESLISAGHEVTCLVRDRDRAERIFGSAKVRLVTGDMLEPEKFAPALEGIDVLFHAAAYFREYYQPGRSEESLRKTNTGGTLSLLSQAEKRGVRRVVYVSSSGVIGEVSGGAPGTEETPPGPAATWNRYFRSKLETAKAVETFMRAHSVEIIQILPGWMFGPGDRGPTGSGLLVINYLRRRVYARISGGSNSVDARDVAAGTVAAAERGRPGEKYLIGGEYVTFGRILDLLEEVSGVPASRIELPYPVAHVAAALSFFWGSVAKQQVLVTPETVRLMKAELKVDSTKAMRELGVRFRPFRETLADEVAWFRANGYV